MVDKPNGTAMIAKDLRHIIVRKAQSSGMESLHSQAQDAQHAEIASQFTLVAHLREVGVRRRVDDRSFTPHLDGIYPRRLEQFRITSM